VKTIVSSARTVQARIARGETEHRLHRPVSGLQPTHPPGAMSAPAPADASAPALATPVPTGAAVAGADGRPLRPPSADDKPQKGTAAATSRVARSAGNSSSVVSECPQHPAVSFFGLYRFTTPSEKLMMLISCVCAVVHGAMLPMWTIIVGSIVTTFSNPKLTSVLVRQIGGVAKWYLILALISFIVSYFQVRLQLYVAQQSGARIRKLYFNSLLRQEFRWYDDESGGELTARVASDVDLIQGGMGDTVGSAVQFTSMFVVGLLIALAYSWRMTLIIIAFLPLLALVGAAIGRLTAESTSEGQHAYGEAGAVASEVLSLIRTVTAFGGQAEEARRYESLLKVAYQSGVKKSFFGGLGVGSLMLVIFTAYS
jgi:ATP-binding cassette, subfamily B (MDR/TAP), member 1